ncbi:hypothetical protein A3852_20855 [Rhodococcus qingshengii]|nr:hypothetical protein A3852_20855 [Rhodococcus qingshengii]
MINQQHCSFRNASRPFFNFYTKKMVQGHFNVTRDVKTKLRSINPCNFYMSFIEQIKIAAAF